MPCGIRRYRRSDAGDAAAGRAAARRPRAPAGRTRRRRYRAMSRNEVATPVTALSTPVLRWLRMRTASLRDVLDRDVVALLLAFAEYRDRLAGGRLPAEAVRPISRMRVARAVDQRRPQRRERAAIFAAEHQLARRMHHAVQRRRRHRRPLRHRIGVVGIDGVRADVDEMRGRNRGERLNGRLRHAQVGHQLSAGLGRRHGRDEDDRVVRPEHAFASVSTPFGARRSTLSPRQPEGRHARRRRARGLWWSPRSRRRR